MQGLQFFDLFIFAMIAAFLVLRLHRVLGRRTGHHPPPEHHRRDAGEVIPLPDRNGQRDETLEEEGAPPPPPREDAPEALLIMVRFDLRFFTLV